MSNREIIGELMEQFEYALPMIRADVSEIRIDAFRDSRGDINLRNAGGSVLEGMAASDLPALTFSPRSFTGNRAALQYKFSAEGYQPGDVADGQIIITSNGGELLIPVHIRITAKSFAADDGTVLTTLDDFTAFAMNNPAEAARVFARKDFGQWLTSQEVRAEMYEHVKFDPVKERAVDNFLIIQGLKKKARVRLETDETVIAFDPGQKEPVNFSVSARLDGWGYAEADVTVKDKAPWINVITRKLSQASFARGQAVIDVLADPSLLGQARGLAEIVIQSPGAKPVPHKVLARVKPVLSVKLNKDSFAYTDSGQVIIDNNTRSDLVVEIVPRHDFLKFQGKRYLIGARAEIPFDVRLSSQRLHAMPERNDLVIMSSVLVKTVYERRVFSRSAEFGVSDLKEYLQGAR